MKIQTLRQMSLMDTSDEYAAFVEKFKPKKTTDDCYTPANVYDVIADWVANEYNLDRADFVRPFWPGGDYQRYEYNDTDVVVDNPPFSLLAKIVDFYNLNGIDYFLFSPYLTNLNTGHKTAHIIIDADILYENRATVNTAFVTNLDDCLVRSAPDLSRRIDAANKINRQKGKAELPKYEYPDAILTATMVGRFSKYGINYRLMPEDAYHIRRMDAQIGADKAIFGSGFLLSEKAAAEKAAAEKAAAEKAAAEKAAAEKAAATFWQLSAREKQIQKELENAKAHKQRAGWKKKRRP